MSLLHDYFNTRNLHLFQRLLEGTGPDRAQNTGPSTSGGRSWKKNGPLGSTNVDVNCRDWLGRTVLHLASASIELLDYVRALLKHPAINVNLPDVENHWTPLHRSLYHANLPAARLLLQRPDIDVTVKDSEGYSAFDLYNSTLTGTKPSLEGDVYADLFTWGANVNAALGLGDNNDRAHPEQVVFQRKGDDVDVGQQDLSARFMPVRVKHVGMSRLHTAVITSESGGNVRVCGFGSGGRLGSNSHTQYHFKPLSQLSQTIVSIALGQDHTLALTKTGEVLSWGLNRFSQLGYPVDPPIGGRTEEPIQYTPRKVQGLLRKEIVKGVAASKCASACWTENSVYTWGTNNGQLGYDKAAQPVQVQPRKVSRLTLPVISITMTENAMACLMQNHQVECFYDDGYHRINFPTNAFPSPIRPYRPPQAVKDSRMVKITSCGDVFASLSSYGEVYIFSPTNPATTSSTNANANEPESTRTGGPFKCQRVWALRKKFSAVKDVALGADGSIIICTESGHVFVRTRNVKSSSTQGGAKAFKFVRVPMLQRVTGVCASASGAFGALRVDFKPKCVDVRGPLIGQDLIKVQPWVAMAKEEDERVTWTKKQEQVEVHPHPRALDQDSDVEDGGRTEDEAIENDVRMLKEMCDAVRREEKIREEGVKVKDMVLPRGADTLINLDSGAVFPVHRVILAARSEVLCGLLSVEAAKGSSVRDRQRDIEITLLPPLERPSFPGVGPGSKRVIQLSITGIQPLVLLVLLHYLYSDNVVTVWDRRVSLPTELYARNLGIKLDFGKIRHQVQGLASVLELGEVLKALERPVKSTVAGTLTRDLAKLFEHVNPSTPGNEMEDVEGEVTVGEERDPKVSNVLVPDVEEPMVEEEKGGSRVLEAFIPDVVLELEDRKVFTHSAILRSRSEFFQSFFDEPDWTKKRWDTGEDGNMVVRINLRHLNWRVMEFVLRFACCGSDMELFETLEFVKNVDEVVEFMFEIMSAANELLLDRLVLICSDVILTYSDIHNACYILADATYFSASQLVDRIQSYITANMELFLESHMLDDIPQDLVLQLAHFVQAKQKAKAPFTRGGQLVGRVTENWKGWLESQDVPVPFVRSNKPWQEKKNWLPLPNFEKLEIRVGASKVLRRPPSVDDIFAMDDTEVSDPRASLQQTVGSPSVGGPAWKIYVAPKADMKAIMAEATAGQVKPDIASNRSSEALRAPSKSQWSATTSPQLVKGSPQMPSPVWETLQQQPRDVISQASLPSTPQKPKEPVRPLVSQGRTSSSSQPSNVTGQGSSLTPIPGLVMGPTITPTRMPTSTGQRNTSSSSKAWAYTRPTTMYSPTQITPAVQKSTPTVAAVTTATATPSSTDPTSSTPPTTSTSITTPVTSKSVSFLAIQCSQQEEKSSLFGDASRNKRSLLEIQEEEKDKREEEEFLRWWEKEEAKLKMEMQAFEAFGVGGRGGGDGSGKQRRGGRGGRAGRGGDGGRGERSEGSERNDQRGGRGRSRGVPTNRKESKNPAAIGAPPQSDIADGASSSSTQRTPTRHPQPRNRNASQKSPHPHQRQQPRQAKPTPSGP
ncbi:hypothetical protein P691DRAFT_812198 [Macrolepiota fuliginosa MF-IS2]|uniref:BTB domain-containing protein n=1 Tax=Macrolepiota fuliginosa MF-IS2 TaxID=1400762 RepID=A0A9P6BXG5_9AGAR|nr:hypothetical protein P691DRAFT_812198 [Macrolepiota fuliginosa MF-IS2]